MNCGEKALPPLPGRYQCNSDEPSEAMSVLRACRPGLVTVITLGITKCCLFLLARGPLASEKGADLEGKPPCPQWSLRSRQNGGSTGQTAPSQARPEVWQL